VSPALLEVDGLSAEHDGMAALQGVSITVRTGEVVALIGGNGAGKSSLMRAVIGLLGASAGRIRFDGRPIEASPVWTRAEAGIGFCPEGRRIFPGMTVAENLEVAIRGGDRRELLDGAYQLFPTLAERRRVPGWQLSGGEQQMLAIARALMGRPRLLLLDEPSLGLAPKLVAELLRRIRGIADAGTAVLLAEQNVLGALGISDHGYVLQSGRITAEGSAAELRDDERVRAAFLGGTG
jgi:branched-chain amino acid transport system ATP-binding protein